MRLRIGTRQSALALAQTELVAAAIKAREPAAELEIIKKTTTGDKNLSASLAAFGGKGAFVSEFEEALLTGAIDVAVHSAKDLPAHLSDGLEIAAVLKREDARDVLVWKSPSAHSAYKIGASAPVIGTSSPRRALQINEMLPGCTTKLLRGNVPTRLSKLASGEYDAIVLAAAGLKRLGLWYDDGVDIADAAADSPVFEPLSYAQMLPAGGQGIIAIECRSSDNDTKRLLSAINDGETFARFTAERMVLERLGAGCHEPVAVFSELSPEGTMTLTLLEEQDGKPCRKTAAALVFKRGQEAAPELISALVAKLLDVSSGNVYLAGAGAGDDGLISIRAAELLSRADAVVYDALSNAAFLQSVRADAETHYVGKTPGRHSSKQEDINALLVRLAREGKTVVRLKGGDPFVFGRGGEEAQALEDAGVPYALVPGVTSAVAALESAGIPVTHREVARSFTVITGHVAAESEAIVAPVTATPPAAVSRFAQYAALDGTLVFLMGVTALPDIAAALIAGGKSPGTPLAIVENGTTVRERRINATLGTAAAVASREHVTNPAVICVGAVAAFDFTSRRLPLSKKRVAVTGTAQLTAKLSAPLKDAGALVCTASYMRVVPDRRALASIPPLSAVSWLCFTSANGVRCFFDALRDDGTDLRSLAHLRFCTVGRGTADTLREYGFTADYMPERFTVADMAQGFAALWKAEQEAIADAHTAVSGMVYVLRAADGSTDLNAAFDAAGIPYRDIALYALSADAALCDSLLCQLDVLDYVTFASSSGARAFFGRYAATCGADTDCGAMPLDAQCAFVCIGEKTADTVRFFCTQLGLPNRIRTARDYTAQGIIEAIKGDSHEH